MALKSIANPNAAYQGSVPKADAVSEGSQKKATKAAKAPSAERISRAAPFEQDVLNKDDADGSVKVIGAGTEALKKAAEEINRNAKNSEAVFGVHDGTNRITIKIIDKDTREVLKEYPPEQTLDMIAKVWEMAGLMVDENNFSESQ